MMGSEPESLSELENSVIDDPLLNSSSTYSNYRSAMSTPADSDPLISPPSHRNPNSAIVFSPFPDDVDLNSEGSNSTFSRSNSTISDFLRITVSNPQKEQEGSNSMVPGGNSYVTYLINTRTDLPHFGAFEFSARRRFKDVVCLADRLSGSYRGLFIPPRPDKSVVESQVMQKQEFVEQRRVALEKYLRRLAAHPVIKTSDELKLFLQAPGKLSFPTTTSTSTSTNNLFEDSPHMDASEMVMQPAKGGMDFFRLFKELKQSVAIDWGGSKPSVVEEDKEFMVHKEKMLHLEQQLNNSSFQAECLVKSQQDIGETMGELGLTFIKLTKFENEEAVSTSQRVRAADMKGVATAAVKASRFYRELNAQIIKHLDALHEYLGLMLAVHNAFSDRSSALLTVQTLLSELSSLKLKAEKLEVASSKVFGGDRSRVRKMEELKEIIRVTEDAKDRAVRVYEQIKENNKTELERLDKERHTDFMNMMKGFVNNQIGYAEKISNVWTKVAEDISSGSAKHSSPAW